VYTPALVPRRNDIDWLRVGAVYLLLLFHSARPFDHGGWHIENQQQSVAVDMLNGAIHQWQMPLLFTLAGWSVTVSLQRRGARGYLRERRDRLLVPLVFGCVALIPFARYAEYRHKGEGEEGFVEFLPSFFTSLDTFTWMHLWFLSYLLVFSLLYLPLFEALRRREWRVERVPPWVLYAAIVPFAAVQLGLRWRWPGYQNLYDDWANFAYFSLFFVAGFLLTRLPALEQAVQREYRRAGLIGLAALAGMAAIALGGMEESPAGYAGIQSLSAVSGVCLVMALLGLGARHLAPRSGGLAYARESAMPVYVIHQVVIVLLAWPAVALGASIPAKLGLVLSGSTVLTLGAYHLVVRRSRVLQRLLGAKGAAPARLARARARDRLRLPRVRAHG
jgi:glucan biosynthesis protein C